MATVIYTVKKGDALDSIAKKYDTTVSNIVRLNDIHNVKSVREGVKLVISEEDFQVNGRASTSKKTKSTSNKPTITNFGLQNDTDRTVFATWKWTKSNTENYKFYWYYSTGDGVWFIGENSTTENKQSTYNAPSNALKVKFKVKAISKKHKVNGKQTSYWTGKYSTEKVYKFKNNPPVKPDTPNVELENLKLKARLDNLTNMHASKIQFQIVKNDKSVYKTITATITKNTAKCECTVKAGDEYKVRARSVDGKEYSDWSDYSSGYGTQPSVPTMRPLVVASSESSVVASWSSVKNAESYTVEYTTKKVYFDKNSGEVQSTTIQELGSNMASAYITGMESGQEYFFRVRAVNSNGESGWSNIVSVTLGKEPAAPTTWSSTTTAVNTEDLILYWVHNTIDGSAQTSAELNLTINGTSKTYRTTGSGRYRINSLDQLTVIEAFEEEEDKYNTNSCTIDTSIFKEGVKIEWRVKTAGITKRYGEWSITRTVDVYAKPTLSLTTTDVNGEYTFIFNSYPICIKAVPGPATQTPIGYHVSITANEGYETVDNIGNEITIDKGYEVYSKYFDIKQDLDKQLSASDVNLENNMEYTIHVIVSMDSGLTAEAEQEIVTVWEDVDCDPNAEIIVDEDSLVAHIRPYYELEDYIYKKVTYDPVSKTYKRTGETVDIDGNIVDGAYTTDGDIVYESSDGIFFYISDDTIKMQVEGVLLSVYRREYDGSFTEIATGLNNTDNTFVTDPHPALDFARYRILATVEATGTISYSDIDVAVEEKAAIVQWEESWSPFQTTGEDEMEAPTWAGSMIKLPYNIDVSDNADVDVALISYVGRSHPVTYYGTQLGVTSTWNMDVPKRDKDTLYMLRRLSIWRGDVYVREPSGSGYWANVKVSYSQKHCELTIPITLNITRVEGGM